MSRRRFEYPPRQCHPLNQFIDDFWLWWVHINPRWRVVDSRGRLVPGYPNRDISNGRDGDPWERLKVKGINGMLNVIACLWWWWELLQSGSPDMSDWEYAVRDVYWALLQLCGVDLEG